MADAAYLLFFVSVLLGSLVAMHMWLRHDWARFLSALRGEFHEPLPLSPSAGELHVVERQQPILEPVAISICRI